MKLTNFMVGFLGGSTITFLFTNFHIMYGSLGVGVLFGLLNHSTQKK